MELAQARLSVFNEMGVPVAKRYQSESQEELANDLKAALAVLQ